VPDLPFLFSHRRFAPLFVILSRTWLLVQLECRDQRGFPGTPSPTPSYMDAGDAADVAATLGVSGLNSPPPVSPPGTTLAVLSPASFLSPAVVRFPDVADPVEVPWIVQEGSALRGIAYSLARALPYDWAFKPTSDSPESEFRIWLKSHYQQFFPLFASEWPSFRFFFFISFS
jgi:hypothetical protein